jgi:23S rRNA (pseudouridine1915-N3)-methyltransferase
MKWQVITVGKPSLLWARAGMEEYLTRLRYGTQVDHTALREGSSILTSERMQTASEGTLRIVLDERGRSITSSELANWIKKHQLSGTKRISVLIGGADGHSEPTRSSADELWCLSALTLQHEMALVLFLEQLYRAYSIIRGAPYHRP